MNTILHTIASLFTAGAPPRPAPETTVPVGIDRFTEVLVKRGMPYEAVATLFRTIDTDGDGKVTRADMQKVLSRFEGTKDIRSVDATSPASTPFSEDRKRRNPEQSVDAADVHSTIADLRRRACTYSRNGSRSFIATGLFVNSVA